MNEPTIEEYVNGLSDEEFNGMIDEAEAIETHGQIILPPIVHDCLICGEPVPEYVPEMCCSGFECGCMGQPTEPCLCSEACWDALSFEGTYDERRIEAGIKKHES